MDNVPKLPLRLVPQELLGRLAREEAKAPLAGVRWYTAHATGDGLLYRFPPGTLAAACYLTADTLLDSIHLATFVLTLQEGEDGPAFGLSYGLLNQCSARMRVPLEAVNQNRWRYEREGAWLKPCCFGARVDLRMVDRLTIRVNYKSAHPVRWCMTPVVAVAEAPPRLETPVLPRGPLLDQLGQSTLHEWPAKSRRPEEVTARLHIQLEAAPAQRRPEEFSRWGGWKDKRLEAVGQASQPAAWRPWGRLPSLPPVGQAFQPAAQHTGFFHTHHDGQRWWLVDPDGYAFWSSGLDCVRVDTAAACGGLEAALSWMPDPAGPYREIYDRRGAIPSINYLVANLIRAFGPDAWYDKWATIVLAHLRSWGFNTVANWSDWQIARDARMPYVRPLTFPPSQGEGRGEGSSPSPSQGEGRGEGGKRTYQEIPPSPCPSLQGREDGAPSPSQGEGRGEGSSPSPSQGEGRGEGGKRTYQKIPPSPCPSLQGRGDGAPSPSQGEGKALPMVYRDFPDVFHPDFADVAAAFAEPLRETADDPAMIGYFLMNEPNWGFAGETPAAGMLFNTPSCASRAALGDFLRQRYGDDAALAAAWGAGVTFETVAEGEWKRPLTPAAEADLAAFSAVMVEKFFGGLSSACRAVDPHHLNLGIRYYTIPPAWALEGMRHFDVFSMNCYRQRVPADEMAQVSRLLGQPILVGEWHFGALDVGLPASGIGHVPDQAARGQAFRVYLEDAAAKPWCVGVHYFTLYDQSALGRFDGENYNIGFLDVCNRPYEPLTVAARASHERLYRVTTGEAEPYDDEPEYLPLIFL